MNHAGHRQRLYERLNSDGFLHDHELLEMLLFNAFPRKNTNPIAHALLDAFGSLKGVLEAEASQLKAVEGVGESVANYLKVVGSVAAAAYSSDRREVLLKNYGDFKTFTSERLKNRSDEVLEIYFCEKNGKVKHIFSRTNNEVHGVTVEREELSALIATQKPYGLLIAHNHLSGDSQPSEKDDEFTAEVQMLCSLNNVALYDHCIYSADGIYSYFNAGRIDKIKRAYNIANILNSDKQALKNGN